MSAQNKKQDPFKEQISAYLESNAAKDKLFAETLKKPNKNIDECINYIFDEVKKSGRYRWTDNEVYQLAVHYYDEDDIKGVKAVNAKVAHIAETSQDDFIQKAKEAAIKNSTATKKETVQQIAAATTVSSKKTKIKQNIIQTALSFD